MASIGYLRMEREVTGVKRPYDGSLRRARAEQVRQCLIQAARTMLLSEGYASTSIPKIAQACEVSVDSVYKRFAGKPALVRAVVEQALEGAGPVPAETRSDALAPGDLGASLRGWGRLTAEVSPGVAPVLLLVRSAAQQDPGVAVLAQELDDNRRNRMRHNAQRLCDAGHLPPRWSVQQVADILWSYSSPELYDLMVLRCGWDLPNYGEFISRSLAAHLDPDSATAGN